MNVNAGGKAGLVGANNPLKPATPSKSIVEDDVANEGLQQTLNLNFSPESREKLRKALDEYAKSMDHDHDQIEARRKIMHDNIEKRFLDADNDGDGTVDRQEATEKLPQVARQFSQIDMNQDEVISLDELVEAQARMIERRKAAEAALEAERLQAIESVPVISKKSKVKQTAQNSKKHIF